jgi:hypothetical protein|tara:strand:- start:281 stop:493 length:213 start_codon:yes stop_codon:yes gene_type:complete
MKSLEQKARKYCANYDIGKCLGVMIEVIRKDGRVGMRQRLNIKKAGKPCTIEGGCKYYDNCVIGTKKEAH